MAYKGDRGETGLKLTLSSKMFNGSWGPYRVKQFAVLCGKRLRPALSQDCHLKHRDTLFNADLNQTHSVSSALPSDVRVAMLSSPPCTELY